MEKGKDGDLEKSQIKVGDISAVVDAGKDLSSALVADGKNMEKPEDKEDYLFNLMNGRIDGEARKEFLRRWGKQEEEKVDIKKFEERFNKFKEDFSAIPYIWG